MTKDVIGFNAGKIWQRLEGELTDTNLKKIKMECQLTEFDFFLALGWLAREDKIKFFDGEKNIYVFPNE
ncbi:MAG: winged helix-turn-helix domain-containing protein [Bacteroidetes bacterium]|jgi:hypothetical protein|nr:winged helix-turn-helix domain-containing protein [Bacteroidota bacterium]